MKITNKKTGLILLGLTPLLSLSQGVQAQQPKITVAPNVQVSIARAQEDHGEVLVAADPSDPNRLVGCSMIFPDPLQRRWSDGITYFSDDGGAHWAPSLFVDSGVMGTGDPACGFGTGGKAYSVYLQPAVKPEMDDVLVYRSANGGKTWDPPSHIDWVDREYITIDTTTGKYSGRIYINGTGHDDLMEQTLEKANKGDEEGRAIPIGISIQSSRDGGSNFAPPQKHLSAPPHWTLGMGNGVVLSDGTYVAVFGEQRELAKVGDKPPYHSSNSWLKVITSTDGGESYNPATVVSDWYMNYGEIGTTSSIVPVIAVDSSTGPFRDRLYVVWPDFRSGRGEILLSYSTDKGKTWSKPRVVNDDRAWPAPARGPDDVMPVVAVNKNGVVGIMWYDRRDNPHNYGWWVRFAVSSDGGETIGPSVRVSTAAASIRLEDPIKLGGTSMGGGKPNAREKGGNLHASFGFGTMFSFNGGHTAGMAADAGGQFHPFWIDNRTGVEQIWTASVSVDGSAVVNGSKELEKLTDVSDKVTLDFKNSRFDRATGMVSIDAYLGNTSDVTLRQPILLRVLSVDSKIGKPTIENASNHEPGPGAVWDFSDSVANKDVGLVRGEVSKPKQLNFRLTEMRWQADSPSAEDLKQFVSFEAKAFAPKPDEAKAALSKSTRKKMVVGLSNRQSCAACTFR
jgi:hypothetical protein